MTVVRPGLAKVGATVTRNNDHAGRPKTALRGLLLASLAATASLIGVLGGWSALTPIASAVVALGHIVVEGDIKHVQHRDGGIIAEIAVANGDLVQSGQLLLRFENTEITASLSIVRERLAAALALQARLDAEQRGAKTVQFTGTTTNDIAPYIGGELAAQAAILNARNEVAANARARLTETLAGIDQEEIGLNAQLASLKDELTYIDDEITVAVPLFERGLINRDRLSQLRLTQAERMGNFAALQSSKDRLQSRRRDATLQTIQIEREMHESVVTARQQVVAEIGQLRIEMATLQQKLDRIDIRAPVSGAIHELQVTTVGGVVAPGAAILDIVPQNRAAAVEVRVASAQIDNIRPGQDAELMLSGSGPQSKNKLPGRVRTVSAAAVPDPQTGRDFFRVEIAVDTQIFIDLGVNPIPGTPIEVFFATGEHTVLSYLIDPITTHLNRAFRE
jgi:HlyD family secretion protein